MSRRVFVISNYCLIESKQCRTLHTKEVKQENFPPVYDKCKCTTMSVEKFQLMILAERVSEASIEYDRVLQHNEIEEFKKVYLPILKEALSSGVFFYDPELESFINSN